MALDGITIFFKLLNFAVLVALIGYVFWRYAYVAIKEQVTAQHIAHQALENENSMLAERQVTLDSQLIAQEGTRHELQEKLVVWQQVRVAKGQKKIEEQQAISAARIQIMQQREENRAQQILETTITPGVIQELRTQMIDTFSSSEQGSRYLSLVVNALEKV